MRRCLILLLMLVLPLQFTWAAAAVYCQHGNQHQTQSKTSSDIDHVGHHEHQHQNKKSADNIKTAKLCADSDCGCCHLAAQLAQVHASALLVLTTSATPDSAVHPLPTRDPDRLERPNWRRA